MGFTNQKVIPRNPPNFEDYFACTCIFMKKFYRCCQIPHPRATMLHHSSSSWAHPSSFPIPPHLLPLRLNGRPGAVPLVMENGKEEEEGRPHSPTKQERNYPARTSSVSLGTTGGTFRQLHYRLSFAADKKPVCCAEGERKKRGNEGCFYYAARHCVFGQSWSRRKGKRN